MRRRIVVVQRFMARGDQPEDWIMEKVESACEASRVHERCVMRTLLLLCETYGLTLSEAIKACYASSYRKSMDP